MKSGIKNGIEVTLKLPSNIVSNSNDENNSLHNFSLTNTQVSNLGKACANNPQLKQNYQKLNCTKQDNQDVF